MFKNETATPDLPSRDEARSEPQEMRELELHELDAIAGGESGPSLFTKLWYKVRYGNTYGQTWA